MPVATARLATTLKCSPSLREKLCLQRSGLTLPSRGHTTAGHGFSLRQNWRRRRVPLTSNVRPRINRMRNLPSTAEAHRTAVAEGSSSLWLVEHHTRCTGVGRPSVGGRRIAAALKGFFQRLRGLSVLRRAARHRFGSSSTHRPNDGVLAAVRRPPADGRPAPTQRVCCSTRRCNQPPSAATARQISTVRGTLRIRILRGLTFEVSGTRRRRSCWQSEQPCPAVVCPLDRRVRPDRRRHNDGKHHGLRLYCVGRRAGATREQRDARAWRN